MQKLIDDFLKKCQEERSSTQMTLGNFISGLENFPQDKEIENIDSPHSYRGYYSDLAFQKEEGTRTVGSLLTQLKTECLGKVFQGYKGGDFFMSDETPMWIANYGSTGVKIVEIIEEDILLLSTAEDN